MTTRALVLGSGGLTGIAWEVGVLEGLAEGGVDIVEWDLVIGSSAGAFVGAHLLAGSLAAASREQRNGAEGANGIRLAVGNGTVRAIALGRRRGLGWVVAAYAAWKFLYVIVALAARRGIGSVRAAARVGSMLGQETTVTADLAAAAGSLALLSRTPPQSSAIGYWRAALQPASGWPTSGRLLVTAVDARTGERTSWDASAGVPLERAMAASAAAMLATAPVSVSGRRYLDGGTRSQTNADLAAGHEEVLVIAPVDRGSLEREVALLRGAGSTVMVIRPTSGRDVLGHNLTVLDAARRPGAFASGIEDGRRSGVALAVSLGGATGPRTVPA